MSMVIFNLAARQNQEKVSGKYWERIEEN